MTGWAKETSPEALSGLFRDWQRTQTQSSVTVLWNLSQQTDVRVCEGRDHCREANMRAERSGDVVARSRERAQEIRAFRLTKTYMDARHSGVSKVDSQNAGSPVGV
jgi:hypothetical protein